MPFCMPSMKAPDAMQMVVVVERPLTQISHGKISCRPLGREPITFQWMAPGGSPVQVDQSGSEAFAIVPGRYRIVATDAFGNVADVNVDVNEMIPQSIIIERYTCVPSSTLHARDGSITAEGVGLDKVERFLWSNGTETATPTLKDVASGTYTIMPLQGKNETHMSCIHLCPPGKIAVRSSGR